MVQKADALGEDEAAGTVTADLTPTVEKVYNSSQKIYLSKSFHNHELMTGHLLH